MICDSWGEMYGERRKKRVILNLPLRHKGLLYLVNPALSRDPEFIKLDLLLLG